jgi:hypothetical protein
VHLAWLSSGHRVGGCSGGDGSGAVGGDGGDPSPSVGDQSLWLIGLGPPPCRIQCQVAGDQAGVAVLIEVLVDEELDDGAGAG